ncbi:uncharacterized protein LOC128966257 [Oppia nitens]|uniref:uncharacterized protein LOC128966257 n=1 Tax=Oppia nitens TaxID=1686743 RepID=UPI0023D9CDDE|nr:uncharacterized protein LOC128966257 [Oppia nitens]
MNELIISRFIGKFTNISCLLLFAILFISSIQLSPVVVNAYIGSDISINLTVTAGESTHLKCPISANDVDSNLVTWIRHKDRHILTQEHIKYTNDDRFKPVFKHNHWFLVIANVSKSDAGAYQCQLADKETKILLANTTTNFRLSVFDTKANKDELIELLNLLDMDSKEQNIRIEEFLERAENILKRAEDPSGNLNPAMIVNEFLPDPMPMKNLNFSEEGGWGTYTELNLKNMSIHGFKQLKISNISFNLGHIQLTVQMDLPIISLQGVYDIDGKMAFVPLYGDGRFWMNVSNIEFNAYGSLEPVADGTIRIKDIVMDVYSDAIELDMENLMGGGVMGGIGNSLVNQISDLIFTNIKHNMMDELSAHVKKMINSQLAHLPLGFVHKNSTNIFDSLLQRAVHTLNDTGVDPLPLPPLTDKFSYDLMLFKLKGELKVYDGYLNGLSSLVRTGDIITTYSNNEVVFEASMGFTNLTGGYNWKTSVLGGGPSGSSSLTISGISCYLQLKQGLHRGAKPTISSFRIDKIKHLWIDVNGLGSWDFILELIMNVVSNAFKLSLANAIGGPVTDAIQKELNQLPISLL